MVSFVLVFALEIEIMYLFDKSEGKVLLFVWLLVDREPGKDLCSICGASWIQSQTEFPSASALRRPAQDWLHYVPCSWRSGVVCCFVCFLKLRAPWQSSWGHSPARLHKEGRGPGPPLPAQAPQGRQALPSAKPLLSPHMGTQPCFKECLIFSPSRKISVWIYSSVDFIISRCLPVLVALNDLWIVWCTHTGKWE